MRFATTNLQRFGAEQYRVVRYEDLVADAERTVRDLCSFLGVSFDPDVLRPTYYGHPWGGNNFDGLTFDRPVATNVDRWRERIDPHEACVIEFHLGEAMRAWGYEPAVDATEIREERV